MNTIAIIQARMKSTRLPGKILKKIKDNVVLDYVIERLRLCEKLDNIVLATTTAKKDDILEKYSIKKKIDYFRGNEEDVLSRYYHTAKKYKADIIVRITSDCPLVDPEIVDEVIRKHIEDNFDYTANTIKRTYPRGLDVEVFNFDVLEADFKNANEKYQREHVTPYIKEHPEKFKLKNIEAKGKLNRPDIRITIDTIEDFELIKKIIQYFNNLNFNAEEIIDFLDRNPDLLEINKNIKQKSVRYN
jgi:spore coat polysaccharide biosynthesis protein SpsF